MHLKEKVKQKFVMRCAKCGYASGNGVTGSFASWLFHEQLCVCKNAITDPVALIGIIGDTRDTSKQISPTETVDVGEQYDILGILGSGGMGTVYKAKDKTDGITVAIKVLRQDLISDPNISKRFEQEAVAVSRLNHPNLVSVQRTGTSPSGAPYIVMDYFDGVSLADLIKQRGHLSVPETIQITMQIAEAIEHAHAFSVIHRDIKPSNILLSQDAESFIVKVVDFGIAKAMPDKQTESAQLTQTGEIFGSPAYMSPEQCLGETVDERSDIYSLGCVMYEMLTGKSPFASDNPIQTVLKHVNDEAERFEIEFNNLHISSLVENIVLKCLNKDPKKRYATISALKQDLHRLGGYPASIARKFAASLLDLVLFFLASIPIFTRMPGDIAIWVWISFTFAYFTVFECSPWQASPGMRMLGLHVVDKFGGRFSWLKSAMRLLVIIAALTAIFDMYWIMQLSMLLLGIGHVVLFNSWHIQTIVAAGFLIAYWLLIAFSQDNISPLDRMFDRRVVFPSVFPNSQKSSLVPSKLQFGMGFLAIASVPLITWSGQKLEEIGIARKLITEKPVVYAVEDVPEDAVISEDALGERMLPTYKSPNDSPTSAQEVVGKFAKYGISAGQIIFQHDLAPDKTSTTRH
jgi:serine/threonine protein kinase